MKFEPVQPAQLTFDEDGTPRSPAYGDVYHARAGALAQAQAVFLAGNDLPARWRDRSRFVVLETGTGLAHNFLATWQAWREDPQRPARLFFVSVDRHPVTLADLRRAHRVHSGTPIEPLCDALHAQWPAPSPDFHELRFEQGAVVLLLVHADVAVAVREMRLKADAFFLDGFNPRANEAMWRPELLQALGRLAAPGATAATWSAASAVRAGLRSAGFAVERRAGFAGKRDMTVARFDPAPGLRSSAWPLIAPPGPGEEVLIVGAGLAGAACAQALAAAGVQCRVLDKAAEPAQGASGNPGGLVHGVLHAHDGAHARWGRAAAWMAERHYRPLVSAATVAGQLQGLLRLEKELSLPAMAQRIASLGLPQTYVQALDGLLMRALRDGGAEAQARGPSGPSACAGHAASTGPAGLDGNAWLYPGGGWLDPAAWVRWALNRQGVIFQGHTDVRALVHDGQIWQALDTQGRVQAQARHVVICAAAASIRLMPAVEGLDWPVGVQRGQITRIPAATPGLRRPHLPVAGGGYALTLTGGDVLCGATTHRDDDDPSLRQQDQDHNLQQWQRLMEADQALQPEGLQGRVGWRFHSDDRLPLVGPAPMPQPKPVADAGRGARPAVRVREVTAAPGLFLATGLGSRGITWAPLVGYVLAAWITGDPAPVPASLMDAVDPRRFVVRLGRLGRRPPVARD